MPFIPSINEQELQKNTKLISATVLFVIFVYISNTPCIAGQKLNSSDNLGFLLEKTNDALKNNNSNEARQYINLAVTQLKDAENSSSNNSDVKRLFTGNLPLNILLLIGTGGAGLGAIITFVGNSLTKRRETQVQTSQYKIEDIGKSKHYLYQLAEYYGIVAYYLRYSRANPKDEEKLMILLFFICKILYTRQEVRKNYGEIQLYSMLAEEIVKKFGDEIVKKLDDAKLKGLSYYDRDRLVSFIEGNLSFSGFNNILQHSETELFNKFKEWVCRLISNDILFDQLYRSCRCYSQIVRLEFNRVYREWYGREPKFSSFITKDVEDYLSKGGDKERSYYNRIKKLGQKRFWIFSSLLK